MTFKKVGIVGKHDSWITDLSVPPAKYYEDKKPDDPHLLLSASRDGLLKLWLLSEKDDKDASEQKAVCKGHRDVVSSCKLSSNGEFAVSCSWDRSMKLWHLESSTAEELRGGRIDKQLNSVIFSPDDRQILTAGGTRIDLWNTLAEIKYTLGDWIDDHKHTDWVSALEWVPVQPKKDEESESKRCGRFLSASWDHKLKLWNAENMKLIREFVGHQGVVHCVCVSPDASLIASGGKEACVKLWDLEEGKHLYDLPTLSSINSLCFSPTKYWLAVATDVSIEVFDLETKQQIFVDRGPPLPENIPWATSLKFNEGQSRSDSLFVGHSDGTISHYRFQEAHIFGW